jgi:hypothetical protein
MTALLLLFDGSERQRNPMRDRFLLLREVRRQAAMGAGRRPAEALEGMGRYRPKGVARRRETG